MNLIDPSVELIEDSPLRVIEIAGKTCYKSENNIREGSDKTFFKRMLKDGHTSVLEHGSVYLRINHHKAPLEINEFVFNDEIPKIYFHREDFRERNHSNSSVIYTNLRVLLDYCPTLLVQFVEDRLPEGVVRFIPLNTNPHKRYTFRIKNQRIQSQSHMRHRVMSFSQESQRYCNYSKDKFNNSINYAKPAWADTSEKIQRRFKQVVENNESDYFELIGLGLKAEEARDVLCNTAKTEFLTTGYLKDWIGKPLTKYKLKVFGEELVCTKREGFLTLRDHHTAHPEIQSIARKIRRIFENLGIDIESFQSSL